MLRKSRTEVSTLFYNGRKVGTSGTTSQRSYPKVVLAAGGLRAWLLSPVVTVLLMETEAERDLR